MKIIRIYTGSDDKSHFEEIDTGSNIQKELGKYSLPIGVKELSFRDFEAGEFFDWHNAPKSQYIVYLEGQVQLHASNGSLKTFGPGDVLLAEDIKGAGHTTRTLSKGRAIIIVRA